MHVRFANEETKPENVPKNLVASIVIVLVLQTKKKTKKKTISRNFHIRKIRLVCLSFVFPPCVFFNNRRQTRSNDGHCTSSKPPRFLSTAITKIQYKFTYRNDNAGIIIERFRLPVFELDIAILTKVFQQFISVTILDFSLLALFACIRSYYAFYKIYVFRINNAVFRHQFIHTYIRRARIPALKYYSYVRVHLTIMSNTYMQLY